jgi:hypothetical protein
VVSFPQVSAPKAYAPLLSPIRVNARMGERRGAYIHIRNYYYYYYYTLYSLQNVLVTVYSSAADTAVTIYMNITASNHTCRYIHHIVAIYTDLYCLNGSRP